jgi:hypothetical protein
MSFSLAGAKDFRDEMRQQKSPYSIFAVKLPIEELVPELQSRFRIEEWQKNIDHTGKLGDLVGVPIIKFKDNPWSIIYWSMGRYINTHRDCRSISWILGCSSLSFYESDASGWLEWQLFQGYDNAESAERMTHDDTAYFQSNIRKKVENLEDIEDKITLRAKLDSLFDELLEQESIIIPELKIDLSNPIIERIDLLILPDLPLGMKEFRNWIYGGHPEYSVFAVKADIDEVIPLLIDDSNKLKWKKDIHCKSSILMASEEADYSRAVIQPIDNQWTIVYWIVGDYSDSTSLCTNISLELKTLVLSVAEEDTSSGIEYKLLNKGKMVERVDWAPGCDFVFKSEITEEPEFDDFDQDEEEVICNFINDRLVEQGVYIPSWELNVSDPWIKQVDLIAW